jgi:riboflavin kinase / FMN adenylyltransferase
MFSFMNDKASAGVVAIGNFDGVHRGHAALLAHAREVANEYKLPLTVLTFEPHPRSYFKPDSAPFRLTPEPVKDRRLKIHGVDRIDVLDFNAIMAGLSAAQFIDMILVDHLKASHVVVGADFRFGKDRGGHIDTLQGDGRFHVHAVVLEKMMDVPVSSSRIRDALTAGDIDSANAMLGWPWEIEGIVERGDRRGHELGYPTANVWLDETLAPAHGIYAVRVWIKERWRNGVASIGLRPMFQVKAPLLEVHVFDFIDDLYDTSLRTQPIRKLRDEVKFDTTEALVAQMHHDADLARAIL